MLFQVVWTHLSNSGICVGQWCTQLSELQHDGLYAEESMWLHFVPGVTLKVVTNAILQETSQGHQWAIACVRI